MAAQVNRIGLIDLRDRYASVCAMNGFSKNSAERFLNAKDNILEFCVAMCEIAAQVDVGKPLIQETYLSKLALHGVFTAHDGITLLKLTFALGVTGYDEEGNFSELDVRATEAAQHIEDHYLAPMQQEIDRARITLDNARKKRESEKAKLAEGISSAQAAPACQRSRRGNR
mmetsp:Transcript_46975/g.99828  ORF Transcript_46975/g.99828 Transcript_46975/m.99828 type:complete len:171 (-) Transcript_46975:955-1467(-)